MNYQDYFSVHDRNLYCCLFPHFRLIHHSVWMKCCINEIKKSLPRLCWRYLVGSRKKMFSKTLLYFFTHTAGWCEVFIIQWRWRDSEHSFKYIDDSRCLEVIVFSTYYNFPQPSNPELYYSLLHFCWAGKFPLILRL